MEWYTSGSTFNNRGTVMILYDSLGMFDSGLNLSMGAKSFAKIRQPSAVYEINNRVLTDLEDGTSIILEKGEEISLNRAHLIIVPTIDDAIYFIQENHSSLELPPAFNRRYN